MEFLIALPQGLVANFPFVPPGAIFGCHMVALMVRTIMLGMECSVPSMFVFFRGLASSHNSTFRRPFLVATIGC